VISPLELALIGGIVGALLSAGWTRWSLGRRAKNRRAPIGAGYDDLDALVSARKVTIAGRLKCLDRGVVCRGEQTITAEDDGLSLLNGGIRTPLEGRVRVVVGSRERVWGPALNELREGDRVVAVGQLRDIPSGDYRDGARVRALAPVEPDGAVHLFYTGTPRGTGLARFIPVLFTAALAGSLGVTFNRQEPTMAPEPNAHHAREARQAWNQANFGDASRAFLEARLPPSLTEVAAHLFADRPATSVAVARRLVSSEGFAGTPRGTMLNCYADALDAREGSRTAARTLELGAASSSWCALLFADGKKGEERKEAIARHFHPKFAHRYDGRFEPLLIEDDAIDDYAFALLRRESDPAQRVQPPGWFAIDAYRGAKKHVLFLPNALMETVRQSLSPEKEGDARVNFMLHFATFESYLGNHRTAAYELRKAMLTEKVVPSDTPAEPPGGHAFDVPDGADSDRVAFARGAVFALRAREFDSARKMLHRAAAAGGSNEYDMLAPWIDVVEKGDVQAMKTVRGLETWPPHVALWTAAATLDGAQLVAALEKEHSDGRVILPFVGNHMQTEGEAVLRFVREKVPEPCFECGPHALMDALAGQREIAGGIGDTAMEDRAAQAMARVRSVFMRRDLAMLLFVLGRASSL
jgi:hypothetical protein